MLEGRRSDHSVYKFRTALVQTFFLLSPRSIVFKVDAEKDPNEFSFDRPLG